jgi:hypothetical protein
MQGEKSQHLKDKAKGKLDLSIIKVYYKSLIVGIVIGLV